MKINEFTLFKLSIFTQFKKQLKLKPKCFAFYLHIRNIVALSCLNIQVLVQQQIEWILDLNHLASENENRMKQLIYKKMETKGMRIN